MKLTRELLNCGMLIMILHAGCIVGRADRSKDSALSNVQKSCSNIKKNVRTISSMRALIEDVIDVSRRVKKGELELKKLNSSTQKCIQQLESFRDLRHIVGVADIDVCHPTFVDKIVAYHDAYVVNGPPSVGQTSVRSIFGLSTQWVVSAFFKPFATQVAFVCKMGLVSNIEKASRQFSDEDYRIVVPWLDKIDSFDLMAPMVMVEQLELTHYQRKSRHNAHKKSANKEHKRLQNNQADSNVAQVFLSPNTRTRLESIKSICPRFKQYYDGAILSIVRLSKLGYAPQLPDVEKEQQSSGLLRVWLLIVQLCDTFENINLAENELNSENPDVVKLVLNTVDYSDELQEETYVDTEAQRGGLKVPQNEAVVRAQYETGVDLRPVSYERNINNINDKLFTDEVKFVGPLAALKYLVSALKRKFVTIMKKIVESGQMVIETNDPDAQVGFARELLESFEQEYQNSIGDTVSQAAAKKDKRRTRIACGTLMCISIIMVVFVVGTIVGPSLKSMFLSG